MKVTYRQSNCGVRSVWYYVLNPNLDSMQCTACEGVILCIELKFGFNGKQVSSILRARR